MFTVDSGLRRSLTLTGLTRSPRTGRIVTWAPGGLVCTSMVCDQPWVIVMQPASPTFRATPTTTVVLTLGIIGRRAGGLERRQGAYHHACATPPARRQARAK